MISYYVRTEEGRFCDVTEMSSENISEYLRQPGRYVASDAPSVEEYEAFFEKNLEDAEQVIHICMAEKSGRGYYRAKKAAERFTNVHVLDCGTTSCGMGLLTLDMIRMLGKTEDVEELKAYFPKFLTEDMPKNPEKAEMFLPTVVSLLVNTDKATVKVLRTGDKWYGVTYAADKPVVIAALKNFTAEGLYPDGLWK